MFFNMADGRRNNGGHKTAGRKSKAEEFKLIERLDSKKSPDWVIYKMFDHIEEGNFKAIELYMGYRYGKPKQQTDITTNGNDINEIPIIKWVNNQEEGESFMDSLND